MYATKQELLDDLDAFGRLAAHVREYMHKYHEVDEGSFEHDGDWFLFAEGTRGPITSRPAEPPAVRIGWHDNYEGADLWEEETVAADDLMSFDPDEVRAQKTLLEARAWAWMLENQRLKDQDEYDRLSIKLGKLGDRLSE